MVRNVWKKKFAAMASGGMALAAFGWGWNFQSCISNAALTNYYTTAGENAIDTFLDPANAIGGDFGAIFVDPAQTLLNDMWSTYVQTNIPEDPIFERLLVD